MFLTLVQNLQNYSPYWHKCSFFVSYILIHMGSREWLFINSMPFWIVISSFSHCIKKKLNPENLTPTFSPHFLSILFHLYSLLKLFCYCPRLRIISLLLGRSFRTSDPWDNPHFSVKDRWISWLIKINSFSEETLLLIIVIPVDRERTVQYYD